MGILTYLVLGIALIIRCGYVYLEEKGCKYHYWGEIIGLTIGLMVLVSILWSFVLFLSLPSMYYKTNQPIIVTEVAEYDIVSAAQSDKIEGRCYLCGGYIEEKPVYKAYKVNDDGSLMMVYMYATSTSIIETDTEKPHIKEYLEGKYTNFKWGWWRCAVFGKKDGKIYRWCTLTDLKHQGKIYIPTGTIKPTFENMNL